VLVPSDLVVARLGFAVDCSAAGITTGAPRAELLVPAAAV
jgi:hypothetical protein